MSYTITNNPHGGKFIHKDEVLVAIVTASNVVLYYHGDTLKMLGHFQTDDQILKALESKLNTL
jgi:hypothetical protein